MTRDEALESAISALTQLMRVCGEYGDLGTALVAASAQRELVRCRSQQQVVAMERCQGICKR